MKIIKGVVHSAFIGTPIEYNQVKRVLTFDDHDSYLDLEGIMYTGLLDFVQDQLGEHYPIELEDTYQYDHPKSIKDIDISDDYVPLDEDHHRLRAYQIKAIKKAIWKGRGIIEIATGGGKTEVISAIFKYLLDNGYAKQIFFVAETRFLMNQAADRFERRGLGDYVRRLGGGNQFVPGAIQVCVVDSLRRALETQDEDICDAFAECDVICFDECHHLQAASWIRIGEECPAKYRYGLTATLWSDPLKYSHSDFRLIGLTGSPVACIPSVVLRRQGYLAEPYVTMLQVDYPAVYQRKWKDYYQAGIVEHPRRNSFIVSLAYSLYEGRYKTLVFVNYIAHGLCLVKALRELGVENACFVRGGESMYQWRPSGRWDRSHTSIEKLAEMVRDEEQCVVVGNVVLDEGIDVPSFNALIMGTAMKKYRRSLQRVGRGMRPKEGDNSVYIFDFIDGIQEKLMEHSLYRMRTYELEEYEFSPNLMTTCERMGIPILVEDGLYSWENTRPERRKKRRKRSD